MFVTGRHNSHLLAHFGDMELCAICVLCNSSIHTSSNPEQASKQFYNTTIQNGIIKIDSTLFIILKTQTNECQNYSPVSLWCKMLRSVPYVRTRWWLKVYICVAR